MPNDAFRRGATTLFAYITFKATLTKPMPSCPRRTSKLSRLAPLGATTAQPVYPSPNTTSFREERVAQTASTLKGLCQSLSFGFSMCSPRIASKGPCFVTERDNPKRMIPFDAFRQGAKSRNGTMPRACITPDATSTEPVPSHPDCTWGRSDSCPFVLRLSP